jgi:hypothetical protein
MPNLSHSLFDHPNKIWYTVENIKLFIKWYLGATYFVYFKILSQNSSGFIAFYETFVELNTNICAVMYLLGLQRQDTK